MSGPTSSKRYHVFVDESSQTGARFMVLGAIVAEASRAEEIRAALACCRERERLNRELKWGKVSNAWLDGYTAFLSTVMGAFHRDSPAYYAVVIDATQLDHHRYNGGNSETGFSKFIYQLLMKVAKLYCTDGAALDCFLDDRTTRQTLEELRSILNYGARKKIGRMPFRRVEYRDSKQCDLIQAVDLITGATAYHWNQRHQAVDASAARVELAMRISRSAGLNALNVSTRGGRDAFSIWQFATGPRGLPKQA